MRYIQSFSTSGDVQTAIDNGYLGKPYVALVNGSLDWNSQIPTDFSAEYLTLDIISGGTISFKCNNANSSYEKTIQYSINDGEWTSITSNMDNPPSFSVSAGDKVKLKGSNNTYCNSSLRWNGLSGSTAYFNVCGNIMSLIYGDNFSGQTSLPNDEGTFLYFFNKTNVVSAHNLILPATTLAKGCYAYMFSNCTSLITAPVLPATTLPDVSSSSYGCYQYMFSGCKSLTTAPELPALTLTPYCYKGMFGGCYSLNYIKCLATDISADYCTLSWVSGVAASGTFIKNVSMTGWTTGKDGIPEEWTVIDE